MSLGRTGSPCELCLMRRCRKLDGRFWEDEEAAGAAWARASSRIRPEYSPGA